MKQALAKLCFLAVVCIGLTPLGTAEDSADLRAAAEEAKPVPILSGGAAFVPTWDSANPEMVSIISPVLLVPVNGNLIFESRAEFEGDFVRRNGNSGDFTGAVEKSLEYAEFDYIGNKYVTFTVGRFLTPFNIFNERLYPNWIRNTQTDPLIYPIGTGSDNGLMVRGGVSLTKTVTLNYAVYFSALSTIDHFESERHTGIRAGLFFPHRRLEIGVSEQHQLQDSRFNRFGSYLQWQPVRLPFDLRAEGAYSREEGSGLWVEGAYRFRNAGAAMWRRTQVVVRSQAFQTGTLVGINPDLPAVDSKRTEFGLNYYITDGWKGLTSYGRTFTAAGNGNIWTVGMTYRFIIPLGPIR